MKRIFLLASDAARVALIEVLFAAANIQVQHDDSALETLTLLERTQVDAVICSEDVGEMSGEEFRNILRYEAKTRQAPVYLLTSKAGTQRAEPPNYDLLPEISTLDLVRQVLQSIGLDPSQKGSELPPPLSASGEGDLHGVLREVGLAELLTWAAEMALDGHWQVEAGGESGYLLMARGDISYAEFGLYTGAQAMLELLDGIVLHPGSQFRFDQADFSALPAPSLPRNINERTERLLMEVTVDLDHRIAERSGIPH